MSKQDSRSHQTFGASICWLTVVETVQISTKFSRVLTRFRCLTFYSWSGKQQVTKPIQKYKYHSSTVPLQGTATWSTAPQQASKWTQVENWFCQLLTGKSGLTGEILSNTHSMPLFTQSKHIIFSLLIEFWNTLSNVGGGGGNKETEWKIMGLNWFNPYLTCSHWIHTALCVCVTATQPQSANTESRRTDQPESLIY